LARVSANITNTFKARLDKFWLWHSQYIMISGQGCREPEAVASFYMTNLSKYNN